MKKIADIDVIIPNYNYAEYLPDCLNSLINQKLQPKRVFFIDDNSNDNSIRIAKQFKKKINNLQIIKNTKNKGIYFNLQRGIRISRSKFIYFMSSDDYINENFFKFTYNQLLENNNAYFCSTHSNYVNANNKNICENNLYIKIKKILKGKEFLKLYASHDLSFETNGILFRKECFEKLSLPNFNSLSDSAYVFLISYRFGGLFTSEKLVYFRKHNRNFSNKYINMNVLKDIRNLEKWMYSKLNNHEKYGIKIWKRKEIINLKIKQMDILLKDEKNVFFFILYKIQKILLSILFSRKYFIKVMLFKLFKKRFIGKK